MYKHPNLEVVEHPLVEVELTILRNKQSTAEKFRLANDRIALWLAYAAMRELPLSVTSIDTPLELVLGSFSGAKIVLVPVIRAALGMAEVIFRHVPDVRVHHIGIRRDEETAEPHQYYPPEHQPISQKDYVVLIDPMLATGGSACTALDQIRAAGGRDIRMICVVAAPEGVEAIAKKHPDVRIFTAALDRKLNDRKYILPGLGDYGDRLYGTKPKQ